MSHDKTTVSKHNLNIKNVELLAYDLSKRLDLNIKYGYYSLKENNKLLEVNFNNDFICLGNIVKDTKFKTYILNDEYYQEKKIVKKHGIEIFSKPDYWTFYEGVIPSKEVVENEKKRLIYNCYEFTNEDEYAIDGYMFIYNNIVDIEMADYMQWWGFCRIFIKEEIEWYRENLNNFRKEVKFYTEALGGKEVYYLDDQSSVLEGVGQGDESEMNWNELKMFVRLKTQGLLLDIPKYFIDKDYRNEFVKKKKEPLAFIDDFRDL